MSAVPDTAGHSRLEHFPITFFATVMGLAGFTLALRAAERTLGLAATASHAMLALSLAALAARSSAASVAGTIRATVRP